MATTRAFRAGPAALLVVVAIGGLTVGCSTSDGAGPGPGPADMDGGTGTDGAAGADARREAGGPPGGELSCSVIPSGCLCVPGQSEPGQLDACSASSVVKSASEEGVCCLVGSLCRCETYVCRSNPTLGFCQCGTMFTVAMTVQGTAVESCPAPTAGQRCCLSTDTNICTCSTVACDDGAMAVPSCGRADVARCLDSEPAVTACK